MSLLNVLRYATLIIRYTSATIKDVKDFFENNENINGQIKSAELGLEQLNFDIEELKSQV